MFLKKKKIRYQDLLNDNNTSMNTTRNINRNGVPEIEDVKIPIKIQKLLKEIRPQIIEEAEPEIIEEIKPKFIRG